MRRASVLWMASALALVACGDDGDGNADASIADASSPDAQAATCDYTEASDDGDGATAPGEPTGIGVSTKPRTICGQVDVHPPDGGVIDYDHYLIGFADGTWRIQLHAADAAQVERLGIEIYQNSGWYGALWVEGQHATMWKTTLPAGSTTFRVIALGSAELDAPVPYTIEVAPYDASEVCPATQGAADHEEAGDTVSNTGNDVVELYWPPRVNLTSATDDVPEATGVIVVDRHTITGVAGAQGGYGDLYRDRDTFSIAIGAATDEIAVRMDWVDGAGTDDDADLDTYLLTSPGDAAAVPKIVGSSQGEEIAGPDIQLFAVQPSTEYLLVVANASAETVVKPYRLTVCPHQAP